MVTLDLILIILVLLGAVNGYRVGFVRQVLRLFGGVIAYFASLWLRPYLMPVVTHTLQVWHLTPGATNPLEQSAFSSISGAISFGVVFIVSFLLLRYAASLIDAVFHLPILSFINRFCGLLAGILLALVFSDVVLYILSQIHTNEITYQLQHSFLARWMMNEGKTVFQTVLKMRSAG